MKLFGRFTVPREYIETGVGVILRVPALFILETWYKSDVNSALQNTTEDVKYITQAVYYSSKWNIYRLIIYAYR